MILCRCIPTPLVVGPCPSCGRLSPYREDLDVIVARHDAKVAQAMAEREDAINRDDFDGLHGGHMHAEALRREQSEAQKDHA